MGNRDGHELERFREIFGGRKQLVVLTRDYEAEPEFLLGECKTNMEINEDQSNV